jgi:hypothetical protein
MKVKRYLILVLMACISLVSVKSSEAYLGIDMSYSSASVVDKSTIEVKCVYVNGYGYLDVQFQWYGDYTAFIPVNYWVSSCGGSSGGSACWTAVGTYIDPNTGAAYSYDNCGNYWSAAYSAGSACWAAVGYWSDPSTGTIWYYDNCGNYWDSYGHYGNSTCGQPGGICY